MAGKQIYTKESGLLKLFAESCKGAKFWADVTKKMRKKTGQIYTVGQCKYISLKYKIKPIKLQHGGDRCSKNYIKKIYGVKDENL